MNKQTFTWKAVYNDGTSLCEFNEDGTDNSFYLIDKTKLVQFILTGPYFRLWFSTKTGEFYYDSELITSISNEYFNLPVDYADGLIQYKDGAQYLVQKTVQLGHKEIMFGMQHDTVQAHYFGYKFKHGDKKVQIVVRIVPDDPTTTSPLDLKIDIKITETDLTNGEVSEKIIGVVE